MFLQHLFVTILTDMLPPLTADLDWMLFILWSTSGVPLDSIRELLGHNNLSTTLGYIYNPLTEAETFHLIVNAL